MKNDRKMRAIEQKIEGVVQWKNNVSQFQRQWQESSQSKSYNENVNLIKEKRREPVCN